MVPPGSSRAGRVSARSADRPRIIASRKMRRMIFESKVLLAFDESNVAAAVVSRGPRGARIGKRASAPLPQGALVPGPLEDNIASAPDVREALEKVHQGLGSNGRRAELILPDGVARLQLLDVPHG